MKNDSNSKIRTAINICILIAAIAASAVLTIRLFPHVIKLTNEEERRLFGERIAELSIKGVGLMVLFQTLQVILSVIPGEPIEIIMGVLYGAVPGALLCLLGISLGTCVIYICVRKFGHRFIDKFINSSKFEKFKFLNNPSRRDVFIFILFFIPGTPKDILIYFAPFTNIPFLRFMIISSIARIPSVISSTYVGANLIEGNYAVSIIAFAVVGVLSLVGILIYNNILKKENKVRN